MSMFILNIAAYRFVALSELPALREQFLTECERLQLKGTVLLAPEGINLSLAGIAASVALLKAYLQQDARFADMMFRETVSDFVPFKRLKVKLKKEIIALRRPEVQPEKNRAPAISPEIFKQWLDEKRDITVLDTRNNYEVELGTFQNAVNLALNDFCEFPEAITHVDRSKPVVMFCTGGIRCEKASIVMQNAGFSEVYQLEGGILNYFKKVGDAYYHGECFVFDERVVVSAVCPHPDPLPL
ncbi:hypothetical protein AYO45_02675 [Gammaproteobacteria bacterium SCGC AG-212-F23]|nr:hypothetical protein AYO45_02675 [Gammaproteobacteria bacterium SCGC AG-212-F23]